MQFSELKHLWWNLWKWALSKVSLNQISQFIWMSDRWKSAESNLPISKSILKALSTVLQNIRREGSIAFWAAVNIVKTKMQNDAALQALSCHAPCARFTCKLYDRTVDKFLAKWSHTPPDSLIQLWVERRPPFWIVWKPQRILQQITQQADCWRL